ncbi:MAG: aspartyl protease family protein [Terriglobales bacterium]
MARCAGAALFVVFIAYAPPHTVAQDSVTPPPAPKNPTPNGGVGMVPPRPTTAPSMVDTDNGKEPTHTCTISHENPAGPTHAADELLLARKYPEAETRYRALLHENANSEAAQLGLTRALLEQNKLDEADALLRQRSLVPKSAPGFIAHGELKFREGELSAAEADFRAALALDPCLGRVHFDLYRVNEASSFHATARPQLEQAYQLSPWDPDVQREWFSALPRKDRIAQLEGGLAGAVGRDPERRKEWERLLAEEEAWLKYPQKRCRLATASMPAEAPLHAVRPDGNYQPDLSTTGGIAGALEVVLNGQRTRLRLDTGASGLLLTPGQAKKVGAVRFADDEILGMGDKGPAGGYAAFVDSIRIGGLEFKDCPVEVIDKNPGLNADGLIGADVFSAFLVTMDFPGRKFKLGPLPPRPDEKFVSPARLTSGGAMDDNEADIPAQETHAEQDKDKGEDKDQDDEDAESPPRSVSPLLYDAYVAPEMESYTRIYRFGHYLLVPTVINPKPGKQATHKLFLLDTGAAMNAIAPRLAAEATKVRPRDDLEVRGLNGKVKDVRAADKVSLGFGRFVQTDLEITTFDLSRFSQATGTEISGILGYDVLGKLTVVIDYRDGLVDFRYDTTHLKLK